MTYLHDPESDLRDPYCIFILCLGWIGVLFFVCLGPCSKRWRFGIFGRKEEVYKVDEDDNTVSVDDTDMTDTMSVTSKGTALEASRWELEPAIPRSFGPRPEIRPTKLSNAFYLFRPATAVSAAGSRPATAATAAGSRPATAKSYADEENLEDDDGGAEDDEGEAPEDDENLTEEEV